MKSIEEMSTKDVAGLFKAKDHTTKDYTTLEEVTTSVVTIDALPGGLGKSAQKLSEPIEVIKTKVVEVHDGLQRRSELMPTRMISAAEGYALMQSDEFTKAMVPSAPRRCRSCDGDMPEDRHLTCRKCMPRLPDEVGGYEYCGVSGE